MNLNLKLNTIIELIRGKIIELIRMSYHQEYLHFIVHNEKYSDIIKTF